MVMMMMMMMIMHIIMTMVNGDDTFFSSELGVVEHLVSDSH